MNSVLGMPKVPALTLEEQNALPALTLEEQHIEKRKISCELMAPKEYISKGTWRLAEINITITDYKQRMYYITNSVVLFKYNNSSHPLHTSVFTFEVPLIKTNPTVSVKFDVTSPELEQLSYQASCDVLESDKKVSATLQDFDSPSFEKLFSRHTIASIIKTYKGKKKFSINHSNIIKNMDKMLKCNPHKLNFTRTDINRAMGLNTTLYEEIKKNGKKKYFFASKSGCDSDTVTALINELGEKGFLEFLGITKSEFILQKMKEGLNKIVHDFFGKESCTLFSKLSENGTYYRKQDFDGLNKQTTIDKMMRKIEENLIAPLQTRITEAQLATELTTNTTTNQRLSVTKNHMAIIKKLITLLENCERMFLPITSHNHMEDGRDADYIFFTKNSFMNLHEKCEKMLSAKRNILNTQTNIEFTDFSQKNCRTANNT